MISAINQTQQLLMCKRINPSSESQRKRNVNFTSLSSFVETARPKVVHVATGAAATGLATLLSSEPKSTAVAITLCGGLFAFFLHFAPILARKSGR